MSIPLNSYEEMEEDNTSEAIPPASIIPNKCPTLIRCKVLRVVDGDTLIIGRFVDGRWNPLRESCRLSKYDSPEIKRTKKWRFGKGKGRRAALEMEAIIDSLSDEEDGTMKMKFTGARGKFGRPLVTFNLPDGTSITTHMIAKGYAKLWKRQR